MKRLILWMFAASIIALPSAAFGQGSFKGPSSEDKIGFSATIHTGPTLRFNSDSPTDYGFHIDAYPGYQFGPLFAVELNIGIHSFKETRFGGALTERNTFIPAFVPGLRARWGVSPMFQPWFSFHAGYGILRTVTSGSGAPSTDRQTEGALTFNTGLGADFWINDTVAVSVGAKYRHYATLESNNMVDISVGTSLRF